MIPENKTPAQKELELFLIILSINLMPICPGKTLILKRRSIFFQDQSIVQLTTRTISIIPAIFGF